MAKYTPLRDRLRTSQKPTVDMTFEDIANLVGGLPTSAYDHPAWWAGTTHTQNHAWHGAGYKIERVSLSDRRVRFARTEQVHQTQGRARDSSS